MREGPPTPPGVLRRVRAYPFTVSQIFGTFQGLFPDLFGIVSGVFGLFLVFLLFNPEIIFYKK